MLDMHLEKMKNWVLGYQYSSYFNLFKTHHLKDVGKLSLMRRYDTKYLVDIEMVPTILKALVDDYSILSINGKKSMIYNNTYFDSASFQLYHQHHNKLLGRLKVRVREYVDTADSYLEIKEKNNKSVTAKTRLKIEGALNIDHAKEKLSLKDTLLRYSIDNISENMHVQYHRISFMSQKYNERVSIDFNLSANSASSDKAFILKNLVVIEVKQGRANQQSGLVNTMKSLHCRPLSFSKYCASCAILFPKNIKFNRFKGIINLLNPHLDRRIGLYNV